MDLYSSRMFIERFGSFGMQHVAYYYALAWSLSVQCTECVLYTQGMTLLNFYCLHCELRRAFADKCACFQTTFNEMTSNKFKFHGDATCR